MIVTYHSMLTAEDIKRECLANKKALDEIFSDPRRGRRFLRKAGIVIPRQRTAKPMQGKIPSVTAAH